MPRPGAETVTQFTNDVLVSGLSGGAVAGLFALAFVVMYRVTGVLNFAQGQLVMLMPLLVLVFTNRYGVPVALSFLLALLAVLLVALIEERIAIRPFMQSGHALPWILSTLGFSVVLTELMAIPYQDQPQAFPWHISPQAHHFGSVLVTWADGATIGALVVLVAVLVLFDRKTVTGLRLRAVSQDKLGASALGIAPRVASRTTAIIAALIAAVTGMLIVSSQLVTPDVGLTLLFNGFIAAAVGGLDSLPGALVGGLVVGVLGQAAATYIGGNYVDLALFGVLLAVYLVRPHGIFGHASVRAV